MENDMTGKALQAWAWLFLLFYLLSFVIATSDLVALHAVRAFRAAGLTAAIERLHQILVKIMMNDCFGIIILILISWLSIFHARIWKIGKALFYNALILRIGNTKA